MALCGLTKIMEMKKNLCLVFEPNIVVKNRTNALYRFALEKQKLTRTKMVKALTIPLKSSCEHQSRF